ncbi:hypothetical protein B296_00004000 [Ensete ventricosum]|uniref:Uncharacterized protein n=1 Tax=Ensete ventricosum TaxID=4639 RepID=A0A427B922_ENSVE|nr:hypothetical protein B296_00004000 [Ensete ventricosum]
MSDLAVGIKDPEEGPTPSPGSSTLVGPTDRSEVVSKCDLGARIAIAHLTRDYDKSKPFPISDLAVGIKDPEEGPTPSPGSSTLVGPTNRSEGDLPNLPIKGPNEDSRAGPIEDSRAMAGPTADLRPLDSTLGDSGQWQTLLPLLTV